MSDARRPRTGDTPKGGGPQAWLLVGGVAIVAAAVVAVMVLGGGDDTPPIVAEASDELILASRNAGDGAIRVLTGRAHTVYHAEDPLPTAEMPRVDGRPTLVWFSATWCTTCERMEPFAHATANRLADDLVFIEKSVDEEPSTAARFRVLGTPTFVLIDKAGAEVARFGYQPDAGRFEAAIREALASGG